MATKYRAGVIGRTGRGNYGHGLDKVYLDMDEIELVAVADDNPEGLKQAGERLGTSRLYGDYREMLDREKLDVVSVCPRWVKPHQDMVVDVAASGACVFLEKPIAQTLAEADSMIGACERAGTPLGIAHQGRMHPVIGYAKRLLHNGAIGTVLSAQMHGKEDRRGGGEDMMVLGTHVFDTLRFMLDADPAWVFAHVSTADGEPVSKAHATEGPEELGLISGDHVHALYGFENGVTATFESRRHQRPASHRFGVQIFGSEGIMSIVGMSRSLLIYEAPVWPPDGESKMRNILVEAISALGESERQHIENATMAGNAAIVRELLAARESGEPPSSAEDGRWSLEMIHGTYASHLAGRRLDLPLSQRGHPLA